MNFYISSVCTNQQKNGEDFPSFNEQRNINRGGKKKTKKGKTVNVVEFGEPFLPCKFVW
jgi:hypothetical protein